MTLHNDVYSNAEQVIFLDKYLEQVGSDSLEQALQISVCEWKGRLWALPKGWSAASLAFLFKDALVSSEEIINGACFSTDYRALFKSTSLRGPLIKLCETTSKDSARRFEHVLHNLVDRRVTHAADELVCVATLLGLKLEDSMPHGNMIDLYFALGENIPQDLIYAWGSKSDIPGWRWAPDTFLNKYNLLLSNGSGVLDRDGFHVVVYCYTLQGHPSMLERECVTTCEVIDDARMNFVFGIAVVHRHAAEVLAKVLEKKDLDASRPTGAGSSSRNKVYDAGPTPTSCSDVALLLQTTKDITSGVPVALADRPLSNSEDRGLRRTTACQSLANIHVFTGSEMTRTLERSLIYGAPKFTTTAKYIRQKKFCFVD